MTEQQIGILVFDRAEGYDSNEDNIVRSYARNLRRRIETYYAQEGKGESLILGIPRGGYAPSFTSRPAGVDDASIPPPQSTEALTFAEHDPSEATLPTRLDPSPTLPKQLVVRWLLAVFVAALGCVAWSAYRHFARPSEETLSREFWRQVFSHDHDTFVVPSDDGLVILQSLVIRPVPLAAYISGTYRSDAMAKANGSGAEILKLGSRRFTSVVDLEFASRLGQLNAAGVASHMVVRYARDLRMDDLRTGNAVLIGSIEANPWIQLFTGQLNFQQRVSTDPAVPAGLVNTHPRTGESLLYGTFGKPHTYGTIAFRPNLTSTGNVLIVGGLNTAGTQAATTFVMTPSLMAPVLERCRTKSGRMQPFELLVGADDFSSNASAPHVIAERIGF